MNALEEGVARHKQLEEIFTRPDTASPEAFDAIKPGVSNDPTFRLALANYQTAVADLDRILNGEDPKLKTVFEETLRNDGVHEYTSTGSCDGTQTFLFRRTPALAANPSRWEEITEIPEEAKYNND